MLIRIQSVALIFLWSALCAGCATSPDDEHRHEAVDAQIASVLSEPVSGEAPAGAKRCLSGLEFRSFSVLDSKHLLFEGRRDQYWVNTLRTRCPGLRNHSVLIVRSDFTPRRLCNGDTFAAADWLDWPWYRRMPWRWGPSWGTGVTCVLGSFQAATPAQVDAIRSVIKHPGQ